MMVYACKKETDAVFIKSPDERLNDTLHKYQDLLTGAPYGWKALIYPAGAPNSVFGFYLRFNDSNRVQMLSDFDAASLQTLRESSWRLKALQQPCLIFDTYSYIHVLCDPDGSHNGGQDGVGLGSDFEFAIDGLYGDTLALSGRLHNSKALLVKASAEERDSYLQHRISRDIDSIHTMLTYFKKLVTANNRYDVRVNTALHQVNFTWVVSGKARSVTTGYYYTPGGIGLSPAFDDSSNNILRAISQIRWNKGQLDCSVNGIRAVIAETVYPVAIDVNAAKRWYQTALAQQAYWFSFTGFHVNGVDDGYGIQRLPHFAGITYWPRTYGPNIDFDMLGFVLKYGGESAQVYYGPGYTAPTFTTDGRVVFNDIGLYGDSLPADLAPVLRSQARMADKQGFFIIQTAANKYDMVSARDGKAWISWQR